MEKVTATIKADGGDTLSEGTLCDCLADNGCGFTVQTDTRMWTRDNVFEAVQILPVGYDSSEKQFNRFTKEATEGLK